MKAENEQHGMLVDTEHNEFGEIRQSTQRLSYIRDKLESNSSSKNTDKKKNSTRENTITEIEELLTN